MTQGDEHSTPDLHLIYPDPQLLLRSRSARALRRLGNAFVRHRVDDAELEAIAEWADIAASDLERSDPVARPSDYFARRYSDPQPIDGAEVIAFSDRTFSGPANPMGVEVELRRAGNRVLSKVVFGAAFESAPGRVHGGAVSAIVADTMGYLMVVIGEAAYTARREADYWQGVPVDRPVWFEAWEASREDRKLNVELTVRRDKDGAPDRFADPLITAEGLFIIPTEQSS
ncbi:MAG: hypothetical protein MKZ77_07100 [Acidimicrobiales bacterium]|nr:hypothetical protein [Acidimicrobiales bacterium]